MIILYLYMILVFNIIFKLRVEIHGEKKRFAKRKNTVPLISTRRYYQGGIMLGGMCWILKVFFTWFCLLPS